MNVDDEWPVDFMGFRQAPCPGRCRADSRRTIGAFPALAGFVVHPRLETLHTSLTPPSLNIKPLQPTPRTRTSYTLYTQNIIKRDMMVVSPYPWCALPGKYVAPDVASSLTVRHTRTTNQEPQTPITSKPQSLQHHEMHLESPEEQ